MSSDPKTQLADLLRRALASVAPGHADTPIVLERPKQASHGDFAANLALQLAKPLRRSPRELAAMLIAELPASPLIAGCEVAGAGFINFRLATSAKTGVVTAVLAAADAYGRGERSGSRVQIEFVSANPTGPLHVGHGRGAAYGASLAAVMDFAGFDVSREYYVNDAGRQMDILALSTWLRYLAEFGVLVPFPGNAYQGDYVLAMAREIKAGHGDRFAGVSAAQVLADAPDAAQDSEAHLDALIGNAKRLLGEDWHWIHDFALTEQLGDGREDLEAFGVRFDCWFSEKSLFDTGLVERAVGELERRGHIYVQDGARWFRSTDFGDEKDRVVQRENGLFTYFASDIAYHLNKYERGFDRVIDIWGADHHGYIPRVRGALVALGIPAAWFEVSLVQLVKVVRGGDEVKMSKRSGEFVTLRDLFEETGVDAARYWFLMRRG
ncbi:MAG: arginine--tRNA ligase, partial [Rhodocyclaceae bacterium]|nr:arginine--tRNA ligase [Rhodocyclaceae bacterium]